jgi:hypothetical protein
VENYCDTGHENNDDDNENDDVVLVVIVGSILAVAGAATDSSPSKLVVWAKASSGTNSFEIQQSTTKKQLGKQ